MSALPVKPAVVPESIRGRNGKLGPCQLTPVHFPGRGWLSMYSTAARAWTWVAAICKAETGADLTAVSAGDVYRSYEMQLRVFEQRYTPTYVPVRNVLVDGRGGPDGKRWYKRRGVAAVASPGTSNHGYGLAIDVAVWNGRDVVGITSSAAYTWLLGNAESLGFSWEVQAEPWHLRYCLGDEVPQRALDCEAWVAAQSS